MCVISSLLRKNIMQIQKYRITFTDFKNWGKTMSLYTPAMLWFCRNSVTLQRWSRYKINTDQVFFIRLSHIRHIYVTSMSYLGLMRRNIGYYQMIYYRSDPMAFLRRQVIYSRHFKLTRHFESCNVPNGNDISWYVAILELRFMMIIF